jgi:hypothetical protein
MFVHLWEVVIAFFLKVHASSSAAGRVGDASGGRPPFGINFACSRGVLLCVNV